MSKKINNLYWESLHSSACVVVIEERPSKVQTK